MPDDQKPLDPQAEAAIARVKRLMAIATATTFIAVAAVLGVVGYRVFNLQGSAAPPPELTAPLPAGARVIASAVGDGRVVLTVEAGGVLELRSYDLETLKPVGRQRLQ